MPQLLQLQRHRCLIDRQLGHRSRPGNRQQDCRYRGSQLTLHQYTGRVLINRPTYSFSIATNLIVNKKSGLNFRSHFDNWCCIFGGKAGENRYWFIGLLRNGDGRLEYCRALMCISINEHWFTKRITSADSISC